MVAAGVLALACLGSNAQAQSNDALIDKLVSKGILTVKEANELREEADKGFSQALQVKNGMPDWVDSLKLNGDLRGRYEGIFADPSVDRNRFRYRMRFGAVALLKDQFEVGLRLTSSEAASGGSGGDPISGNTTMTSNGSKKLIYLDLAYGKWTPINNADWNTTFTLGKMENPFVFSDMIFDGDYTPEGAAQQFGYNINNNHSLKLNVGEFAIYEDSGKYHDTYMFGGQLRWEAKWAPKMQSSMGIGGLALSDSDLLLTTSVPNQNYGNERNASGQLVNSYNPIVVDGSVTYNLDSFPMYVGQFPIKLAGDYLNNPAADKAAEGYSLGMTFGKSGKKGLWELSYRWKELQGDAWYEEVVDSDFGAYYTAATTRGSAGYRAGTNVRGHIVKASYSPYDSVTLGITYFLTEIIDQPTASSVDTGRLQVDASFKF